MGFIELVLIAVGLSMDAFAVAVCKGLSVQKLKGKHYLAVGLWFGGFQALMPTLGYLLGTTFEKYITSVDHWVATSVDALAVGITFALLPEVNIFSAVGLIGLTTCCLSALGLKVGNIFGLKYKSKAEIAGGIILILIGVKILLEHLGVINF